MGSVEDEPLGENYLEQSLSWPKGIPRLEWIVVDEVPTRDVPEHSMSQALLLHSLELVSVSYSMLEAPTWHWAIEDAE